LDWLGNRRADKRVLIGQSVRFRGTDLKIVGVFAPDDRRYASLELGHSVFMPALTMKKHFEGYDPNLQTLRLSVDPESHEVTTAEMREGLIAKHRGVEDFDYVVSDWVASVKRMLANVTLLICTVSLMTFFAGSVSIMNVMLCGLSERIRDIGIHKTLGASRLCIFVQFMAESITLSFLGGLLGGVVGILPIFFKDEIRASTQGVVQPVLYWNYVAICLIVFCLVGFVSGVYPALKAAKLAPVDALRYG